MRSMTEHATLSHHTGKPALGLIGLVGLLTISGCTGLDIDNSSVEEFQKGAYQSFSWRLPDMVAMNPSRDLVYRPTPALRVAINTALSEKGYRHQAQGGDFFIDYRFETRLSDGVSSLTVIDADNRYPPPTTGIVINREHDPALVDNAYALSGPKAIDSVSLRFADGRSQAVVWAFSVDKIVENRNNEGNGTVHTSVRNALLRALQALPDSH